jgi:hypothetical protein
MLSQLAYLGCSGTPGVPESAGLRRARKCFIERAGRVGRQIVLHGPDACGFEIMDIDEFAHALGVVLGCPPLGDLDLAPRPVHVDADEEIDGAVAPILAITASPKCKAST